jgi:acyl-coenzyme A synthetase/AMP-(fatty) acid ligase
MDGHVLASFAGGQEHSLPPPDPALACVLHTSGSTGTPKAVPISWHAQDVFVGWMMALLAIDSRDRILRVAELTFDLAWFDHLAAWRAGATLCTMSRRDLAAAASLHAAVRRLQPSVIYGVPGLFMNLVAALGPVALLCPAPRVCCFAGEVFPPKALLELARRVPDAKLYNLFGPTETNVCSYHAVDRATLDGDAELPIGKACPYAECRIVDERGETIHGEGKGELVVRGPTAVGGEHATRDCVERRSDGLFYFCGRMDRVVKIRGFRIDPTEVECALLQCPGVGQAAVLVTEHPKFGRELVAYVAADVAIDPRPLRQRLSERLAPQMVPRTIEWLASLPRTTNGKIDYRRLANAAFE